MGSVVSRHAQGHSKAGRTSKAKDFLDAARNIKLASGEAKVDHLEGFNGNGKIVEAAGKYADLLTETAFNEVAVKYDAEHPVPTAKAGRTAAEKNAIAHEVTEMELKRTDAIVALVDDEQRADVRLIKRLEALAHKFDSTAEYSKALGQDQVGIFKDSVKAISFFVTGVNQFDKWKSLGEVKRQEPVKDDPSKKRVTYDGQLLMKKALIDDQFDGGHAAHQVLRGLAPLTDGATLSRSGAVIRMRDTMKMFKGFVAKHPELSAEWESAKTDLDTMKTALTKSGFNAAIRAMNEQAAFAGK